MATEVPHMSSQASQMTLGLLPEAGTRWGRFIVSYGVQSLVMAVFIITAIAHPEVLTLPVHDYHFNRHGQHSGSGSTGAAPVRTFPVPKVAQLVTPRPEAMRVPAELVQKKPPVPEEQAPKVTLAAKKEILPDVKRRFPGPRLNKRVSPTAARQRPPWRPRRKKYKTGGFGDPNGVPGSDPHGRPVTIAQAGSFDMPSGPGYWQRHRRLARAQRESSPALVLAAASPLAIVLPAFPVRAARFARAASETPT